MTLPVPQLIPADASGVAWLCIPVSVPADGGPIHVDDVVAPAAALVGPLDDQGAVFAKLYATDPQTLARRDRRAREMGETLRPASLRQLSAAHAVNCPPRVSDRSKNTPLPPDAADWGATMPDPEAQEGGGAAPHGADPEGGARILHFPTRRVPIDPQDRTPLVERLETAAERFGVPLDAHGLRLCRQAFFRATRRGLPADLDPATVADAITATECADVLHPAAYPWGYLGGCLADACGKLAPRPAVKNAPQIAAPVKNDPAPAPTPKTQREAPPPRPSAPAVPTAELGPDGYPVAPPCPEGVHAEAWAGGWAAVVRCQTIGAALKQGKARDFALKLQGLFAHALEREGALRRAVERWATETSRDESRAKRLPTADELRALLPSAPRRSNSGPDALIPVPLPVAEMPRSPEHMAAVAAFRERLASANPGALRPVAAVPTVPPLTPEERRRAMVARQVFSDLASRLDHLPRETRRAVSAAYLAICATSTPPDRIEAALAEAHALLDGAGMARAA